MVRFYTTFNKGHRHTYTSSGKITSFNSGHSHKILLGRIQKHGNHKHNKTRQKVL